MSKPTEENRIKGVVLGTAIGDALGWPVEFMKWDGIQERHGRVKGFLPKTVLTRDEYTNEAKRMEPLYYPYTDDTQMFRAVCDGLLQARAWKNYDNAAQAIAKEFVKWRNSPDNDRAPGSSCLAGCRFLELGVVWHKAGVASGGCGAAMRSMAYGIWHDQPWKAADWAAVHAAMTHRHPKGMASAAAVAAIVAALRLEMEPLEAVEWGIQRAGQYEDTTAHKIMQAMETATEVSEQVASGNVSDELVGEYLEHIRINFLEEHPGWAGDDAVASSVLCFLLFPDSFEKAVLAAVNCSGDSDSLGAITGAFSGAYLGYDAINIDWIDKIEKTDELQDLGETIYKVKKGVV